MIDKIKKYLGEEANDMLKYKCEGIKKESLHLPGPDFVDRVMFNSDRSSVVLRNLQLIFNTGRLAGTGYLSVLPVDQGIEHSAGAKRWLGNGVSGAAKPVFYSRQSARPSDWATSGASATWPTKMAAAHF